MNTKSTRIMPLKQRTSALSLLGAVIVFLGQSLHAAESVPGGLYLHPLPDGVVDVRYRDQPVLVYRQVAVVGIHLNAEPGTHKIQFIFEPKMFDLGLWISIGTLVLLLGIVAISVVQQRSAKVE